jgi:hypothetical protein
MFHTFTDPSKPLSERFSKHNFAVGMVLFVWGMVTTAIPPDAPVGKSLARHPRLETLMSTAQIALIGSAALLVLSGYGVRQKELWGYQLAAGCGIVFIIGGLVFFVAFRYLGSPENVPPGIDGLHHAVARMYWVRNNFDFIIGFVDGCFLLVFLYMQYQRDQLPHAEPPQIPPVSPPPPGEHRAHE